MRINVPFLRTFSDKLNRSLCILKRANRFIRHYPVIRKPVFKNKGSNTLLIEFPGYIATFPFNYQQMVPSSRTNNDCSTVCFFFGRKNKIRNNCADR